MLKFESVKTEKICDGIYKLEAGLAILVTPTYLTDSAKRQKIDQPVHIALSVCGGYLEGEAVLDGKMR